MTTTSLCFRFTEFSSTLNFVPLWALDSRTASTATWEQVTIPRQLVPDGVTAENPAFDLTPARLIDALLTEPGAFDADALGVAAALRG